jgi:acetylornithine deacetylase
VSASEADALARLDAGAIARDTGRLVGVASVTGDERAALELVAELCAERGLDARLVRHDLAGLRARPGHPGEEAPREELAGLEAAVAGSGGGRRLCLNGHVDVVGPGEVEWEHGPWSGRVAGGFVHGRGAADMKGGVVAALHALAAVRAAGGPPCEVVLQAVASEEDGGQGTFAALEADDRFDACLIPEPTAFALVCAHAGALTFRGVVHGRAAHAAFRLAGESAIDRYVAVHAALAELERDMNARVEHPLMAELELPYPLLVGRVAGGRWSSTVPDRLEFEGRVGVPVGESPAAVRRLVEDAVARAAGGAAEVAWTGGQFGSGATPLDDPFVALVAGALADERGAVPRRVGMPYGADMRLFTERGIPCAMAGPGGLERVHGVDERVAVDDLLATARTIVRTICRFR